MCADLYADIPSHPQRRPPRTHLPVSLPNAAGPLIPASQASALALQEKERIASEEAEKRLKAALTAKREPNVTASRVASPNPAAENASTVETTSDAKPTVSASQSGDVVMESAEEKPPAPPEVRRI